MNVVYKAITGTFILTLTPNVFATDIGVIPDTNCPANSESIRIYMDDEDDRNASRREGWVGATQGSTQFRFCRVNGDNFKPLSNNEDYAVLKLSDSCPNNSIEFNRYFDNEDDRNANNFTGNIYPNIVNRNTNLKFCYFEGASYGMDAFPDIGVEYGVFASKNFSKSLASGTIYTDDEDDNNANRLNVHGHNAIKAIIHSGRNTTLNVHKVETTAPALLFSSGFENNVYIDPNPVYGSEDYDFIRGTDNTTGFSWPIDILGASESALHRVAGDGELTSEIQTVDDGNGALTKALYNHEKSRKHGDTQLTYEILNITQGKTDLYVKYRMKIDSNMLGTINKWRALFEYKTKDYKDPGEGGTGYRLIAFIYTDMQGRASWHFQGDKDSQNSIWECDTLTPTPQCNNTNVPVITDEWFTTEYYWHWSNDDDGYVVWKINGEIVGEHHGPTTRNDNPIDFILLTQLYGDVTPKYQWIDDIEIWDGLPIKASKK